MWQEHSAWDLCPRDKIWRVWYSVANCWHYVVQQVFRSYSFYITKTLYLLKDNSPFPPLPTDEWMKEMWYTHAMADYSALKKKEILPQTATWVPHKDIMLSEISQQQENK